MSALDLKNRMWGLAAILGVVAFLTVLSLYGPIFMIMLLPETVKRSFGTRYGFLARSVNERGVG